MKHIGSRAGHSHHRPSAQHFTPQLPLSPPPRRARRAAGGARDLPGERNLPHDGEAGTTTATPADGQFLRAAVMLGMTALEASRSVQLHAEDSQLRGLARQISAILARIDAESRRLAVRYAVPVADKLDREHRARLATLTDRGGPDFARTYLCKFAMEAQLELIRLCSDELTHGSAENLRAAAGRWLQDLRMGLEPARRLYLAK